MDIGIRIRNVRRRAWWLVLVSLAVLALAAPAARSVKGIVCTQSGIPLKGAVVQLKNTQTLGIRSYITRKDGSYQFHGLEGSVDYELRAAYHGARSAAETLSMFDERPVAFINLSIEME